VKSESVNELNRFPPLQGEGEGGDGGNECLSV